MASHIDGLGRKTVPGLGIAQPSPAGLMRQTSFHGLIENAAPMGDTIEHSYQDASPEPRGSLSPRSSPGDARTQAEYTWDRPALGMDDTRDGDAISLDSLQMHDEPHDQPRGFSPSLMPEVRFGRAALDDTTTDQTPLRGRKKAPKHVKIQRLSCASIWLLVMSLYSTIMSGVWLFVAIIQPRWGSAISTSGPLTLSTASLLTAIFAKTIELSFVTLAMAFVGQVLTRRAIATHEGMTMAEVTMRNWIAQPGTIFTNLGAVRHVGHSLLGVMALIATLVVMFYTTASDTMVRPKLQFGQWKNMDMKGTVWASYANTVYVNNSCTTPMSVELDPDAAGESCLSVQYSGNTFSDFSEFLTAWSDVDLASLDQAKRPQITSMLWQNVTMVGTWIETQYSNVTRNFETHSRIINNVSVAMPHPGVYRAATNKTLNGILQPSDLDGVGSYNVSASVVSPALNVLCVNMNSEELEPLVYTSWRYANKTRTGIGNQTKGWENWSGEIPAYNEWTNTTVVDDIFHWHDEYGRLPPAFQMFPSDYNTVANSTGGNTTGNADTIYVLGKSHGMDNYTLCGLQSWLAIQCSTRFNVSGTTSMAMSADCSQDIDYYPENATLFQSNPDAYVHTMKQELIASQPDWRNLAQMWTMGVGLTGGNNNDDAAIARILTQLALTTNQVNATLPSLAEALATLAANTLITGSINTPFIHYWNYSESVLTVPDMVSFKARVKNQEYASWHIEQWHGIFYVVLAAAFIFNVLCLVYLFSLGLIKDFLEPSSLFALATAQSGGGHDRTRTPEPAMFEKSTKKHRSTQMGTPYLLNYRDDGDFFFEEAADGGKGTPRMASGLDVEREQAMKRKSFGISFDSMRRMQ